MRSTEAARIQPIRRPPPERLGERTDRDHARVVDGRRTASTGSTKPSSTNDSSTIIVVPACRAARRTARRDSSSISAPVGLWKSGDRAGPGAARSGAERPPSRARPSHLRRPLVLARCAPRLDGPRRACRGRWAARSGCGRPGPISSRSSRSRPCRAPLVTKIWSALVGTPRPRNRSAIASRSTGNPPGSYPSVSA